MDRAPSPQQWRPEPTVINVQLAEVVLDTSKYSTFSSLTRRLRTSLQDLRSHVLNSSEDPGCPLPPQASLRGWVTRGQALTVQCSTVLQQLSCLLQCCPEDLQRLEGGLSCPSPLTEQRQAAGCLKKRGAAEWNHHNQHVAQMLKQTETHKAELNGVAQQGSEGALHTWTHFDTCCSAFDHLNSVVNELPRVEQLFLPSQAVGREESQPAIAQTLRMVREQVEAAVTEFTTWKTQLLFLGPQHTAAKSVFCSEFSAELETQISTVLCAVQTLVKRSEKEMQPGSEKEHAQEDLAAEEGEAPEELLKPGHLSRMLEEELEAQVEALRVGEVNSGLERLFHCLRSHRDSCLPPHIQEVDRACKMLVRLEPVLGTYSDLVRFYLAVSVGVHRSTGKLLSVLSSIFTELAQKGFCLPQELTAGGDGEGATEFHDYEGGGMGEGEGSKDVSDKIENEDQVEDTFQEGQEKEEQQDKGNIRSEDNAIEMSEDFDGQMHDGEQNESGEEDESDKEDEEELDKKMGDLGEGQTDTLDERLWGDEDSNEEDGSEEEEESGQGMDQGESELVAKDDNLDAADPNKDKKKQDREESGEAEEKEQIHEQGDQREFDENEVDPYHGQQDKRPEPEAMDLPEDLNLDQEDEGGDEGEGDEENPYDIEEKTMGLDEEGEGEKDQNEEDRGAENMEEQAEEPGEEDKQDGPQGAQGDGPEEEDGEGEKEEGDHQEAAEEQAEEEERGKDGAKREDCPVPNDKGQEPKDEEGEDEEHLESAERKDHEAEGQTGDQNVQSETAVELGGEASERDQAKEEHGSGAADASQSEGHESQLTARMASQRQTEKRTQSYKRKPGQADNERSTGDYNERINKRLRTVDRSKEQSDSQTEKETQAQQESDLYEHIRQGESSYDTQTYDVASAEQQKAAGPQKDQEQNDEVAMETEEKEEELQSAEVQTLNPDQLDTSKSFQKGVDSGDMEVQTQGDDQEDQDKLKDRQPQNTEELKERTSESTIHTVPELLLESAQREDRDPDEMRREMEQQLEVWHKLPPGNPEEVGAAACLWHQYQTLTSGLSQQLCEQLRLILEPTQASKLRGDYRTGKRLNMKKVIPYIASQFRKDKIWLRRTKPSKREYQICLALDDSSSMVDNHSKQMAFESLSVIVNALTLLEVGQVAVCSFGEEVQLLHPFQQQFNDDSGARILRLCQFQQKKTRIAQFLETSTKMFLAARQQIPGSTNSETAQLLLVVSDGRGLFLEGKEKVSAAVRAARSANVFVIFVVLDNPNSRDSILDIKVPIFGGPGEMPEIRSYMDEFPFPFYVILRDVNALPETLSDALRQWFELVTASDH